MRPTVCKVCNSAHRARPPIRCAMCAIPGAARTSAGCAPRCARCAIRRAGHAPHTVCKVCHSGCGPDLRGMRPTVCKVCNSTHRTRPHTVCKVCHSGCGPDFRRMRPTVCKVCHSARRTCLPYGVQCVPFRVRPGPPRDAPDGVQGVQFDAPGTPPIRCAMCAIPGAARTSAGCAPRCAMCAIRRAGHAPIRCATCAITGAVRTSARHDRRCARCAIRRVGAAPIRCATCAIPGAARTSAECAPTVCKVCNSARRGCPHTVCNVCHSGCGPDLRGMRPTVCKLCNSARRVPRAVRRRTGFTDAGAAVRTVRDSDRRPAECSGP